MKLSINKKDRDAFLRTVINAGYNYQLHESDNDEMLSAYVMDSFHRELSVTESFWLGSIFRCEIQDDIRKAIESDTEPYKGSITGWTENGTYKFGGQDKFKRDEN
jgi:hypothetical protein